MNGLAVVFGTASTTLFAASQLPMVWRAVRTRDLTSYSTSSLLLANIGNLLHAVYVYSLPAGPLWFLHAFYLVVTALMLWLRLAHRDAPTTNPEQS